MKTSTKSRFNLQHKSLSIVNVKKWVGLLFEAFCFYNPRVPA